MSILKRSVLYSKEDKGQYRFLGWAITNTSLGACMEPFNINDRQGAGVSTVDFDPSDMIARVDDLQPVPARLEWQVMSHGETMPLHGGDLMPRTLIKTGNF